jgi:hypothetical protein
MPLIAHKFLASKKLYAFDKSSFTYEQQFTSVNGIKTGAYTWRYTIQAVWFRKRSNGRLAAFTGILWDHSKTPQPLTADEFISTVHTARYGGTPEGCWDGNVAWWAKPYSDSEDLQAAKLPFLKDMLAHHPETPNGYDGWYLFTER